MVDAPNRRLEMGESGRAIAESRWSPSEILVEFEKQLRALTKNSVAPMAAAQ